MIIAISGYFIWLHVGHIEYIQNAARMGEVYIILNNDVQQVLKYGRVIMPLRERAKVLKSLKGVKEVIRSVDEDRTVCKTLERLKPDIFCNGGDRTSDNIPEIEVCEKNGIQMVFEGDKIQSSSWLMKK